MSYTIRKLTHTDFDAAMALGSYAFKNDLSDEQREQQRQNFVVQGSERYGLFEGEQLCSQLALHQYDFSVQGKSMRCSGVAFVCSWPEYRRNGYVANLLEYSLKLMKDQGEVISALHPFSVAFYRKFGYELLSQRVKNCIPVSAIKRKEIKGQIVRETNFIELKEMYDEYSKLFNGMIIRKDSHWERFTRTRKKDAIVIYKDSGGRNRGYIVYTISGQQMKMNISEFIALDIEAERAIWSFIGQHDSMIESIEWFTPFTLSQLTELTDSRITREIQPIGMIRIVDCKAFIEAYRFVPSTMAKQEQFFIHIEDQYASWNNGLFCLTIQADGAASLEKINVDAASEKQTIMITINTLCALFMGYYTAQQLIWNERISGDTDVLTAWSKRIPQQQTQLLDFF